MKNPMLVPLFIAIGIFIFSFSISIDRIGRRNSLMLSYLFSVIAAGFGFFGENLYMACASIFFFFLGNFFSNFGVEYFCEKEIILI